MGWLQQITPPDRYDPSWMRKLVELIRTAINFQIDRTCVGSPVGLLTPTRIGEEVFDTGAKEWYKSVGLTRADWKPITSS